MSIKKIMQNEKIHNTCLGILYLADALLLYLGLKTAFCILTSVILILQIASVISMNRGKYTESENSTKHIKFYKGIYITGMLALAIAVLSRV